MNTNLVYLTFTPFTDMVSGPTANYYDSHLENLASIVGRLRVLHFGVGDADRLEPHPRVKGVVHHVAGGAFARPAGIVRWALRGSKYLDGPTLVYLPYVSPACIVAAAWKRLHRCGVYLRLTWSPATFSRYLADPPKKRLLNDVSELAAFRSADFVGVGSDRLRGYVEGKGVDAGRIRITTNYVDTENLPVKNSFLVTGKVKVAMVGRLHEQKRIDWLVETARRLPVEIHLFGDGPLRGQLQEKAAGLPVVFHGQVPNADLGGLLKEMDIFAMPSRFEAVPKALLEALAIGLPCVGCDVDGVADWLGEGRGVIAADDRNDFIEKVGLLISNAEMREAAGRAAAEYARRVHNRETVLAADKEWVTHALGRMAEGRRG